MSAAFRSTRGLGHCRRLRFSRPLTPGDGPSIRQARAGLSGTELDDNDHRGGPVRLLQTIGVRHARIEMDRVALAEDHRLILYYDNQPSGGYVKKFRAGMLMRFRRFRPRRKISVVNIDLAIVDIEIQAFEEV